MNLHCDLGSCKEMMTNSLRKGKLSGARRSRAGLPAEASLKPILNFSERNGSSGNCKGTETLGFPGKTKHPYDKLCGQKASGPLRCDL